MHKESSGRQHKKYSKGFKQAIISEIQSGKTSILGAQHRYGIGGATTIQRWIKAAGKPELLPTIVHIRMKDEVDELPAALQRIRQLEKIIAELTIDKVVAEAVLKVASHHYGTDLKKTFGSKL